MAACSKYKGRLKTALEFRGLEYPIEIITYLGIRATTDSSLDRLIHSITDIIEPPSCHKSHCPHFTAFAFCNCSKHLVPGKCPLNLKYLKDKRDREEKKYNERVLQIPSKCMPASISEETKKKIIAMSDSEWSKYIRKSKKS